MKITIINKPVNKANLKLIYDTCNRIFKNEDCFYTKEQVIELKKDKSNIFL